MTLHPFAFKAFVDNTQPPDPPFTTTFPPTSAPSTLLLSTTPTPSTSAAAAASASPTLPAPPPVHPDRLLPTARLSSLSFSLLRPTDVHRLSHLPIVHRSFYLPHTFEQQAHGVLDRHLGVSTKTARCQSCGKGLADCIGHFGHIDLTLPVFHIGYFKEIIRVLQAICKACGRVLLSREEKVRYLRMIHAAKASSAERAQRAAIHERYIVPAVKKRRLCVHCGGHNGVVKKLSTAFRITHELRHKDAQPIKAAHVRAFDAAVAHNAAIAEHLHRAPFDLSPLTVLHLFSSIPPSDCLLLNFDPDKGRPQDMILTSLVVPPACIRPSVTVGVSGSNEDDLTVKLGDVIFINNVIAQSIEKGATVSNIAENWDFLQQQVAMYINADLPGFPKTLGLVSKPIRALIQRLKGKQGRFRGNLSGKRVDFSSRTVISPDPNLRIDEVGVPELVAKSLTFPDRVHSLNIDALRQAVLNGCDVYPGANTVEYSSGLKISLKYGNRVEIAKRLRFGDIVERHLRDGDVVLFNRQPSLHRLSIMAHRVKVLKWRTFRFNEAVCTPYNADFDGDEMNLHCLQQEEARVEALTLMGVEQNLVTPRHGEPLVTAIQDFITTAYLITQKDVFYDRAEFTQIASYFADAAEHIDLPPPIILKPLRLWSGKQIMSLLIRPNSSPQWPLVNLELKERNYTRELCLCQQDGYVVIRHSQLMCGNWAKSTVGGDKAGLLYSLIRDHSPHHAAVLLNRLAKLSARWIGNRGFSIGIDDVTPSPALQRHKRERLSRGYAECAKQIGLFRRGELIAASGCDEEQTLESNLLGTLSAIREELGSYSLKELDYQHNSPLIMAVCGSKGSKINISQMISAVGQQAVNGQRIPNGFVQRTLPHFPKLSRSPAAKGFVENSFYSGLTATEFFFHTMGGREGLVDTAVKTAETGYMQRRLMKALEDLCVQYDETVRTSEHNIVQFVYGDDGLDPIMMTQQHQPVQFARVMEHVKATVLAPERCLMPAEIRSEVEDLQPETWRDCSGQFVSKMKAHLLHVADDLQQAMDSVGIGGGPGVERDAAWHVINQTRKLTRAQLTAFFAICHAKYRAARIEPGTAVGAIGAQSIGEPGTQMTLKTFHFAGVASMNITLGVPRIKEVINAAKKISTPIITAPLVSSSDVKAARIVKGRIERTTLGEVSEYIEEVFTPTDCYLLVKLDLDAISHLQLHITADSVVQSILSTKKLRLKSGVYAKSDSLIRLQPQAQVEGDETSLMFAFTRLKAALPAVVVQGVANVNRAVINDVGDGTYNLLVEGYNLLGVMTTLGVRGEDCTSNHVDEMCSSLGIEAARQTIIREIQTTMEGHGMTIDYRHMALLADTMCYRGRVLGITRFGVAQMKESVLMLASFEKTADHLFEAALRGVEDGIEGVSESIIMGTPIPVGTGLFQLLHAVKGGQEKAKRVQWKRSNLLMHEMDNKRKARP